MIDKVWWDGVNVFVQLENGPQFSFFPPTPEFVPLLFVSLVRAHPWAGFKMDGGTEDPAWQYKWEVNGLAR
jgi:hypothetical protein